MYNSLIGSRDKNLWTLEQNPPPETWSLIMVKICYGIPKFNSVFTGVRPKSDKSTISTYIILYDQLQSKPPIYATAFNRPISVWFSVLYRENNMKEKYHSVTAFVTFLAFSSTDKKTHSLTKRMSVRCIANWMAPSLKLHNVAESTAKGGICNMGLNFKVLRNYSIYPPGTIRDFKLPPRNGGRTALFWTITQRVVAIPYWRFGTTSPSRPKGQDCGCSWSLNMGPIGCSETSVRNYHYSLRHSPGERSSHIDDVREVSSNGSIHLLRHVPKNRLQLRRSFIAGTKCDTLRRTTKPPSYTGNPSNIINPLLFPDKCTSYYPLVRCVSISTTYTVCVCVCMCVCWGGGEMTLVIGICNARIYWRWRTLATDGALRRCTYPEVWIHKPILREPENSPAC